jgi:hypothetical protein
VDGSELTDQVSDIADEEVLSLRLVEPALYCIPDQCSAYFENVSHFTMLKCKYEMPLCLLLKHSHFDIRHGIKFST